MTAVSSPAFAYSSSRERTSSAEPTRPRRRTKSSESAAFVFSRSRSANPGLDLLGLARAPEPGEEARVDPGRVVAEGDPAHRLRPRRDVVGHERVQEGYHLEVLDPPSGALRPGVDVLENPWEELRRREVEDHPVPDLARELEHSGPEGGDVDRHPAL